MSPCRSDYIFTDVTISVWHVVSEDSDHLSARLTVIHSLRDLRDRNQTFDGEMCFRLNQPHALNELFEVVALRCAQLVLLKKRDDRLEQIISPHHAVLIQMFFVVVVSSILIHLT